MVSGKLPETICCLGLAITCAGKDVENGGFVCRSERINRLIENLLHIPEKFLMPAKGLREKNRQVLIAG